MAIISAGVVMNVIFAFLMAVVAFSMGVEQTPCVIGTVFPGEPAWQADLRVGDEILEIAGKKMDAVPRPANGHLAWATSIRRRACPCWCAGRASKSRLRSSSSPTARAAPFSSASASSDDHAADGESEDLAGSEARSPVLPGSAAARAKPAFRNGDKIVQIDDVPIDNYAQIDAELARKADRKIAVTVDADRARRRRQADGQDAAAGDPGRPAIPCGCLGLVMKMGPITAVQADSPAAAAGIMPGDVIEKIDGNAGRRSDDAARPTPPPRRKDGRTDHPAEGRRRRR